MAAWRQRIDGRRWLAGLVLGLALLLRLAVPAGFMPVLTGGHIGLTLCSGTGPMEAAMAMPGRVRHDPGHGHDKPETPCAFSGLAAPALGGADPIQLALALLFIVAAGLVAVSARRVESALRLRPPLRAPPARA